MLYIHSIEVARKPLVEVAGRLKWFATIIPHRNTEFGGRNSVLEHLVSKWHMEADMKYRIMFIALISTVEMLGNAEARTYSRSCTGGIWVTYYSDAYHMHTAGWLDGVNAQATASYNRYQPNTLRGRARDRLKNDCFQNLSCSGERQVGGKTVNMTRSWPYPSNYENISQRVEQFVCNDARLNFQNVRSIRAQLKITGDVNCGLSNSKTFSTEFFWRGTPNGDIICTGVHPR